MFQTDECKVNSDYKASERRELPMRNHEDGKNGENPLEEDWRNDVKIADVNSEHKDMFIKIYTTLNPCETGTCAE